MRDGLRIIDADSHVVEPLDLWQRRLPPSFADRAPRVSPRKIAEPLPARFERLGPRALLPLPPEVLFEGRSIFWQMAEPALLAYAATAYERFGRLGGLDRPEAYVAALDRRGVDVAVLYPTYTPLMLTIEDLDPDLAIAVARVYNEWLGAFCAFAPARLRGAAVVSLHDPARTVAELDAAAALGFRLVIVRPNPQRGRLLGDPAYEPFWAACEARGVAVGLHGGTPSHGPWAGADRFHTRFAEHACAHPMEHMMGFLSLLEGGVLERHPKLRVAFLESGGGWLPYWLFRLDEEQAFLGAEVADQVREKPSTYFRRQCFIGVEPGEPYLADLVRHIGEDSVVFGTDFPHLDHDERVIDQLFALRGALPEGAIEKMLWDNPARLYGVEP
jgi:predicted TIM-barrel fold metal-dependent hydrolase